MESNSKLVNVTRQEDVLTANGAVTNSTSLNNVLDLFFIAGASRNMQEKSIKRMLEKAWVENELLTLKCIFWAGDVRGGAGERRFFRIALSWLHSYHKDVFDKNYSHVPEFNRWDSLFAFTDDNVLNTIATALFSDKNALCAKWMPRKKQYNNFADSFRKKYRLSPKAYRQLLVELSDTVEQKMCANKWKDIKYPSVPSVAMNKYRTAFCNHDLTRFQAYIDKVLNGEETINARAIYPYDIYRKINTYSSINQSKAIIAQWEALPNYLEDSTERILPVCDVSGSMSGLPMDISISLGVYISERNQSVFKDAFITFSSNPAMNYLKGNVIERFKQLRRADWNMSTNLNKVFDLILNKGIDNNLTQDDMPTMLLIISDMEFNNCGTLTNYQAIVEKYKASGFTIPKIVFWNVNGREGNVPVNNKTKNVALISGASPSILKSVLSGKVISPTEVMKDVLNSERYENIKI